MKRFTTLQLSSFPRSSVGTHVWDALRPRLVQARQRSGEEVCTHAERGNKENRLADSILTILRPGAASAWKAR